jgi:hypothetical protein
VEGIVQGSAQMLWIASRRKRPAYCIEKENEMNTKTEGNIAILAALLVLYTSLWDPRISVMVSLVGLLALVVYLFLQNRR